MTAKIAATLQFLTGGRYILGIGAGWKEDEYRAYGYPFPPARERIGQLEDAVRICKRSGRAARSPTKASITRSQMRTACPAPEPPPALMIGGAGEQRTLRVVAQYADWWNADYYSPADYARKLAILHDHCRAIGRDPSRHRPNLLYGHQRLQ